MPLNYIHLIIALGLIAMAALLIFKKELEMLQGK